MRGITLDEMVRELIETRTAMAPANELLAELTELWRTSSGDSRGVVWTREELHERSNVH